jgi:hypothetical protein
MQTLLNTRDDMQWLADSALSGHEIPLDGSAILYGNEDSPDRVDVYASADPDVTDPYRIFALDEAGEMVECDGPRFDRFDVCAAHRQIESDYNLGGWIRERASNARRREATAVQLQRMNYRPSPLGDMTPNAWAIYRALESRYHFTRG